MDKDVKRRRKIFLLASIAISILAGLLFKNLALSLALMAIFLYGIAKRAYSY